MLTNNSNNITSITIRVYGILLDENRRVLLSDELIKGNKFTKFPGGGLELGEGTKACLQREFKEEANIEVTIGEHIYTTDFFQQSAFNNAHQIISIYYFVTFNECSKIKTSIIPFDFSNNTETENIVQNESFRWIEWEELSENSVQLPIDKIVINILKEKYNNINS